MKLFLIFFVIILFCSLENACATHAMGADLTYRCLGPGSMPGTYEYEITFSFYRDCSGIGVNAFTGAIDITNSCGYPNPTLTLSPTVTSPTQISPICINATSTCNGGTFTGIEEWVYQGNVTLPGECGNWTFSHSEGARNIAVTTISAVGGDNLFVYSTLNNLNGVCNNSPVFSNIPVPFSCVGQRFCFNHGAYDAEGDSIVYELITPRTGPSLGDTVDYNSPYSKDQPILSNPPMSFNSNTGNICMYPIQADVSVIAVLVKEFRNGLLIGEVERDMQISVLPCNNVLPVLGGFNGTPSFTKYVCTNMMNCFNIYSYDPDTANITSISWDNSIQNVTFSTTQGYRDTALICWMPAAADTIGNPYCFTVSVSDNNCPYLGVQVFSYCFIVTDTIGCSLLSINENQKHRPGFIVYPQPANEELILDFGPDFIQNDFQKFSIENILGEGIYQSGINQQKISVNISHRMESGIYFVRAMNETGKTISVRKIIIAGL